MERVCRGFILTVSPAFGQKVFKTMLTELQKER